LKNLIVTADDFGADVAVNEAVERGHTAGVLTAASLMVAAPAMEDAVARARRLPSLRVGLHLVLVEAQSLLGHAALPDLTAAGGGFRTDMVGMGVDIFFKPRVRRQLAAEIRAQFEAFAATGLPLDHVNTHKHFHLHPTICGLIVQTGREFGLRAMRVPAEPRAVLRAAEPQTRAPPAAVTAPWAALVRGRLRRAGVLTPDAVFGLAWTGAVTAERLRALIPHLPDGLSEVYLHPATANSYPGSAPGYRYTDEFAALIDPEVIAAARTHGFTLGGFADFTPAAGATQET
jgi:hopanoid biosynthesis associated protein HpnK